jgi:undecaprenyl-diphosphatase
MSWWQGMVLGAVQGLTEFLPVSSSGHLVVAEAVIGLATPGVLVEVALHVATLLAVAVVYRRRLWELLHGIGAGDSRALRYVGLLFLASVPAGIVGFLFKDLFERAFDSLLVVGLDFAVTGCILWSTRFVAGGAREAPSTLAAGGIGLAQAVAILPGISRSGTTVAAGLWLGLDPVRAAEFSFLMAMPAIAGAGMLEVANLPVELGALGEGPLLLSFLTALVTGVLAIRLLVALLRRGAFHQFAPYCWGLALITIVWAVAR